jgi:hypothetical protein
MLTHVLTAIVDGRQLNSSSVVIVRESGRSSNRRTDEAHRPGVDRPHAGYWMPAFAGMTTQ